MNTSYARNTDSHALIAARAALTDAEALAPMPATRHAALAARAHTPRHAARARRMSLPAALTVYVLLPLAGGGAAVALIASLHIT